MIRLVHRDIPSKKERKKMLFLLCHNIKTDIIMRIAVYLFLESVFLLVLTLFRNLCFFREFWYAATHKLTVCSLVSERANGELQHTGVNTARQSALGSS